MDDQIIRRQEELLRLESFSNDIGLELGRLLVDQARHDGRPVGVDISRCGHQIFHASMEGMTPDIDGWLQRKSNTVYRIQASTLGLQVRLRAAGLTLHQALHLDPAEFVDAGGGFPIVVKHAGFVGAIAVSGTTDREEHELITRVLARYLGVDCPRLV